MAVLHDGVGRHGDGLADDRAEDDPLHAAGGLRPEAAAHHAGQVQLLPQEPVLGQPVEVLLRGGYIIMSTRPLLIKRRLSEGSRRFHNNGEGPYADTKVIKEAN